MARRKSRTPVVLAPLVGAVKITKKVRRSRRASSETVTVKQMVSTIDAVTKGTPLPKSVAKIKTEPSSGSWVFVNRKWVVVYGVGFVLLPSRLLMAGGWVLPGVGGLIFAALLSTSFFWLRKVSRSPLKKITSRAPEKVRPILDRVVTPFSSATATVVMAVAWWGASMPINRVLWSWVVGTSAVASVRAWRFRIRAEVETRVLQTPEKDWEDFIVPNVPQLAGSRLLKVGPFRAESRNELLGWKAKVRLKKGSVGATAVTTPSLQGRIASTYGTGKLDVIFEVNASDDGEFSLTVMDQPGSSAMNHKHSYNGSDFDPTTGVWTQGIRADWTPAKVRLFDPKVGAFHGHISGATGGGKSETMVTMLTSVTAKGVVCPLVIDLGTTTFANWKDTATIHTSDPDEALQLLRNVLDVIQHRNLKLGQMVETAPNEDTGEMEEIGPLRVYPISREEPFILVVFDEWSKAISEAGPRAKEIKQHTQTIVEQGRKVMVGMCLAGQPTGLVHGFGNNTQIRTMCQSGYMIAHRNNAESGHQVFGGEISAKPSDIPSTGIKGACYLVSNVDLSGIMARSFYIDKQRRWNKFVDIPDLPVDEWEILTKKAVVSVPSSPAVVVVPRPAESTKPGPKSTMKSEIEMWLMERGGEATTRKDILTEFQDRRNEGGSKSTIYRNIDEMIRDEVLHKTPEGLVSIPKKEVVR